MMQLFRRNPKTDCGFSNIKLKSTSDGSLGVELHGIFDITSFKDVQIRQIKKIINEHHLVVVKGNRIWTECEQKLFTGKIGELEDQVVYSKPPHRVSSKSSNTTVVTNTGIYWHSDNSYQENPSHISVFQMTEIPSRGAKTYFASLIDCYSDLLNEDKEVWKNYSGVYRNRTLHPLIWKHPFNGKFTIYFDIGFASDIIMKHSDNITVPVKEANRIINYINDALSTQKSRYTHTWSLGDIVLVDNYAVAHRADILLENERQTLLRTTTKGIYF